MFMNKVLLCILLAAFIGREVLASIKSARYSGDSVLLNKRLHYFGGRPDNNADAPGTMQEFIYLNISESFNVNDAQSAWEDVEVTGTLTAERNYGQGMCVIPEENSIMIYGGAGSNTFGSLLRYPVMLYNATSDRWQDLTEPPNALKQPNGGTCSRGDDHKAYVFGGLSFPNDVNPRFSREMNIYDFTTSTWNKGAPLPSNMNVRYNTPTTLAGKDLYYIGGTTANYTLGGITALDIMIPMTEILIYHIEDMTWEIKTTTDVDIPEPRVSHTIAAKPNSQEIVLYGGKSLLNETTPILGDFCYTLDTSSMTWKKQDLIGTGLGPLYGHSAVFADNSPLLFVMFGVNNAGVVQNGFGVLDTEEWKWVDQYNSPYPPEDESDGSISPGGSSSSSGSLSSGAIAGIVVGCVAGVALVVAFCFIRKRRNRNAKNEKNVFNGEANVINFNNGALAGRGHFKPEDASDVIPNATLSPLLPAETAPPYRGNIPNEIDPPKALFVQNTTNAQAAPRLHTFRPVKPDRE